VRRLLTIPLILLTLATAGCGGCNSRSTDKLQGETDVEARNKKLAADKLKEKPLEIKPLLPMIGQEPVPETDEVKPKENATPRLLVKPGHWTTTVQEMKTNYEDFVGRRSAELVDMRMQPVPLDDTNFTFQSTRPVALAKGRVKRVESELFLPEQSKGKQILVTLRNNASGQQVETPQPLLLKMPSYQYFIVVLAKEIDRYAFLKVTDAVRMPWEEEFDAASQPHYRVVLADATRRLPLPSNTLTWSSVSHLIWDNVDPTQLSPQQQLALLDWLHWGGRLIINGPDSLDTLRGSFLADYLPADSAGPRAFDAAELDQWSAYWTRRDRGARPAQLQPLKPWSGIKLKPREAATELAGRAGLFYECNVGRGTVVVSGIQLARREFINWPGYDSFLNAGLLRRNRRVFSPAPYDEKAARVTWADFGKFRLDAHFSTELRMFARDAGTSANQQRIELPAENQFGQFGQFGQIDTASTIQVDRPGGLGTWSDFNPVSDAARSVLLEAAAVRVPGAGFVITCLGLYLLALVPLNWMVFRALDRVEWAWIAAPIIALLGTIIIVRQAQLDIGFVRSQTEVALLELHDAHPRGLLSRFTALYSSLSTTYDVTFADPTTVATPFPARQSDSSLRDKKVWDVVLEKQDTTRLSGLAVSSASTRMVHSEEMFTFDGPLRLGKSSRGHDQIENRLGYSLRDVVVIRRSFERDGPAKYESCWLGELRDRDAATVNLRPLTMIADEVPHADERQQAAEAGRAARVDVEALMKIAFAFPAGEDPSNERREEYRVVGLIDQVLPGTEVTPAASQIIGGTVVLAHLNFGKRPPPRPDVNSRTDVIKKPKTVSTQR